MLALQQNALFSLNPLPGCWEKATAGAIKTWDAVWEPGNVTPHIITWLFFRIVCFITPGIIAIEVLLGHAISFIQGLRSKTIQADLQGQIKGFQDKYGMLTTENQQLAEHAIVTDVTLHSLQFGRDQARREVRIANDTLDGTIEGRAAITRQRDELLAKEKKLTAELNEEVAKRKTAEANNTTLQNKNDNLNATADSLTMKLKQADVYKELAEKLKDVDRLYKEHMKNTGQACKEIDELLPFFEQHIELYRKKITKYRDDLNEDSPLRVLCDDLLYMSKEQSKIPEMLAQIQRILEIKTPEEGTQ